METTELPRNPQAFKLLLLFVGFATTIVGLIAAFIVGSFFHFTLGHYAFSRILTFLIIVFIAAFALMIGYYEWKSISYKLSPEGIIVSKSSGLFGKKRKVYLYESIISASYTQHYFGTKYGYGDIHIEIPKLEKQLVLKDVYDPSQYLPRIQAHMRSKTGVNNVLVT